MNGFDFLPPRGTSLHALWEQRERRVPAAAVAAALVLVALIVLSEQLRLGDERVARERAQADLAVIEARVAGFRHLELRAREDHALAVRALTIRHSAVERAGEIAEIGNRLSGEAWLSGVQHDAAGWRISGGATRLRGVSATILALRSLSGSGERLESVAQDDDAHGTRLRYQLVLGRQRP